MPRMMIAFQPLEFVIALDTTYLLINSKSPTFRTLITQDLRLGTGMSELVARSVDVGWY
jgi:hypothetical protein